MNSRLSNYFAAHRLAKQFIAQSDEYRLKGNLEGSLKMLRGGMGEMLTAMNNLASIAFNSKPKRRKTMKTTKLVVAMLFLAVTCQAKPVVTVLGGGVIPTSDIQIEGAGSDRIGSNGGAIGAQVMFPVSDQVSVGVDFLANDLGAKQSDALITGLHTDYHLHANTFLVGAKLASKRDKIEPFLFGGIGIHSTSMTADVSPAPGLAWADTGTTEARRIMDDSATGFALAMALGLDYYVTPALSLGAEGRYEYLASTNFETKPIAGAGTATIKGNVSAIALLMRVSVHF